jgi:endonuclease YncB( thermonuclease family)
MRLRLDVEHHRLALFWVLSLVSLALPWLMAELDWSALPFTQRPAQTCTVASVHDGDTLRAECLGERVQVRLHCIDAPELAQRPWGPESRDHLRKITPPAIALHIRDTDRYGRRVAEVLTIEGDSVNLAMVAAGHAAVYRRYCSDPRFLVAEREARERRAGIWAMEGDHQQPWAYRQGSR